MGPFKTILKIGHRLKIDTKILHNHEPVVRLLHFFFQCIANSQTDSHDFPLTKEHHLVPKERCLSYLQVLTEQRDDPCEEECVALYALLTQVLPHLETSLLQKSPENFIILLDKDKVCGVKVIQSLTHHYVVKKFEAITRRSDMQEQHADWCCHAWRVPNVWSHLAESDQDFSQTVTQIVNFFENRI